MAEVVPAVLARQLADRFGIGLEGRKIEIEGGRYTAIRPTDLPEPNGFAVVVSATPRRSDAYFFPDSFAGALVRSMSDADKVARETFVAHVSAAAVSGVEVLISLDGLVVAPEEVKDRAWTRIEIECSKRMVSSGTKAGSAVAVDELAGVATICLALATSLLRFEEAGESPPVERGLPEGARSIAIVNRYERNPANRAACLGHYGPICAACNFNFEDLYGDLGAGFAEVHHRVPVSKLGGSYVIDPINDLVPLCSNCHAMIHRRDPPIEVEKLREVVKASRAGKAPVALGLDEDRKMRIRELYEVEAERVELGKRNEGLETRVLQQAVELERIGRLRPFLPPQLAQAIISSGDEKFLERHRCEIVALFCDLRGFTSFAENAEPEDLMGVLAQYHGAIGPLIHKYEGMLDHFTGDGMMVFFNDPVPCPDAAERATKLALEMRDAVAALVPGWTRRGHLLGFGVGMAQGYATLGCVGFEGRFDYTAIGAVVNLASRLCSEASHGQVLVSGRLAVAAEAIAEIEELGERQLKGMAQKVVVINLRKLKG